MMAKEFFNRKGISINMICADRRKYLKFVYKFILKEDMLHPGQEDIYVRKYINQFMTAARALE
jgi:hypothetical protein